MAHAVGDEARHGDRHAGQIIGIDARIDHHPHHRHGEDQHEAGAGEGAGAVADRAAEITHRHPVQDERRQADDDQNAARQIKQREIAVDTGLAQDATGGEGHRFERIANRGHRAADHQDDREQHIGRPGQGHRNPAGGDLVEPDLDPADPALGPFGGRGEIPAVAGDQKARAGRHRHHGQPGQSTQQRRPRRSRRAGSRDLRSTTGCGRRSGSSP